jgi:hypothetical protein
MLTENAASPALWDAKLVSNPVDALPSPGRA